MITAVHADAFNKRIHELPKIFTRRLERVREHVSNGRVVGLLQYGKGHVLVAASFQPFEQEFPTDNACAVMVMRRQHLLIQARVTSIDVGCRLR